MERPSKIRCMDAGEGRGRDDPLSRIPGTPEQQKVNISKSTAPKSTPRNKKRLPRRCCAVRYEDIPEIYHDFARDLLMAGTDFSIRDNGDTLIVPVHTIVWMARNPLRPINELRREEEIEETDTDGDQNNA